MFTKIQESDGFIRTLGVDKDSIWRASLQRSATHPETEATTKNKIWHKWSIDYNRSKYLGRKGAKNQAEDLRIKYCTNRADAFKKGRGKSNQKYMYVIINKDTKIALWIDRSNKLKENSVKQVPPFSINNKPISAHWKSQIIKNLEEVIIAEKIKNYHQTKVSCQLLDAPNYTGILHLLVKDHR